MKKSSKKSAVPVEDAKKWKEAANRAREHIVGLEAAIRVFERNAESGEPWPENEKAEKADALSA